MGDKVKFALYLPPEKKSELERRYQQEGFWSVTAFIEKAIDFYLGYLDANSASTFLPKEIIGTRDGVELPPSGYMGYMAEHPRFHGLFGDEENVDMDTVMQELNEYPGNIWTHIISLKREDAERLGYDHAAQWKNLLRAHRNEIAEAMHIPPNDFRWYAAFHNEGDHPHVHMMAWSAKPGQAYPSQNGIRQIKSKLTGDIFRQEMLHIYEQKSSPQR